MSLFQIMYYIVLAFGLFIVLNYFQKLEEKMPSVRIIVSILYLVFISELPGVYKELLFLIPVIELVFRNYYVKMIQNQVMEKEYYLQNYGITFILSYFLTELFLTKVETIFPTTTEMRLLFWLFVIIFVYKLVNGNITFYQKKTEEKKESRKEESIVVWYAKFKSKYSSLLKNKDKDFCLLVYSMMIYENFNRSSFLREIDRLVYRFTGKITHMGVMQVESSKELNDEESIQVVVKEVTKIEKKLLDGKKKIKDKELKILEEYGYLDNKQQEILRIYNILRNFDNK